MGPGSGFRASFRAQGLACRKPAGACPPGDEEAAKWKEAVSQPSMVLSDFECWIVQGVMALGFKTLGPERWTEPIVFELANCRGSGLQEFLVDAGGGGGTGAVTE